MPTPVVLLHGWGGSFAATWARNGWVEALEGAGYHVLPVDLPGHGGAASHDPASYGDLTATVAAGLPEGPLDLIGYSLGAKIALALAVRRPGRFASIVVGGVGDNLFAPERQGDALATAMEDGLPADASPALADLVGHAQMSASDPRALAAVLRRSPNPLFADDDLACLSRVLLVNGDNDQLARPDIRLRKVLGDPDYLSLPGVDHVSLPADVVFRHTAIEFLRSRARNADPRSTGS